MTDIKDTLLKNSKRSVARKVADHLTEIEEAMELGISQAEIIKFLAEKGIAVTFINFKSIIRRLRAKKRKGEAPKKMIVTASRSQGENTSSTSQNSPVAKSASPMPAEKQSVKHEPIIASPPSSRGNQSWHDMRKEKVEW